MHTYYFIVFFSLLVLIAVMMDEPRFAQPIPNVTVAVGRDANLPCVVEHLGAYKVWIFCFQKCIKNKKNIIFFFPFILLS